MILAIHLTELNKWFHGFDSDEARTQISIVRRIERYLGLTFVPGLHEISNVCLVNSTEVRNDYKVSFTSVDLLDYIYALLHSAAYREIYESTVYINYSLVPSTNDPKIFWNLVGLGSELRQLHLLQSPVLKKYITSFPQDGSNEIHTEISKKDWEIISPGLAGYGKVGRIWISETQYFDNIPLVAWEFCVAGYRPAQKWLKDRRGRILGVEDILHYQKIILSLTETHRLMAVIDTFSMTTLQKRC